VIVTIVLLKEACTCAMPSAIFFLTFLRTRVAFACCGFAMLVSLSYYFFKAMPALRGPLRVRAFVLVR
jgi:hypothetical protein